MRGRFPHIKRLRGLRLGTPTDGQVLAYEAASGLWKPASALPASAMEYKGAWNASTNTPTLADGTGSAGDVYRVSAAASRNLGSGSIDFAVGDYVIYNGSTWEKGDTSDAVSSVNSETGAVSLSAADVGAIPDTADAVTVSHIASNAVGASEIGSLPAARVYNSTNITLPTGTATVLTFDTERFDTDSIHSGANPSRLTCATPGLYLINASVRFASNATGGRQLFLKFNGTTVYLAGDRRSASVTGTTDITMTTLYKLAADEYVEVEVVQASGGNLDVVAIAANSPEFSAAWIGEG